MNTHRILLTATRRHFCSGTVVLNSEGPKAPYKTSFSESDRSVKFDRNMPMMIKKKAWERDSEDKESWFKRKHAHHHVLQKRYEEENPRRRRAQVDDDKPRRPLKETLHKLKLEPMIDYLFGTNAVLAALTSNKRSFFGNLYIHNTKDTFKANKILALAKDRGIDVKNASKQDLNQMTNNAVHNGIVLECRPLQTDSIYSLSGEFNKESFSVEKEGLGYRFQDEMIMDTSKQRYPLGLYLDEISDPHNVGAILRSAYFLGVDFVVFSERNCAPLTPVVSKTSAGSMEFLKLFNTNKPMKFFEESRENGWCFVSAIAPADLTGKKKGMVLQEDHLCKIQEQGPVVLVVGSEGAGIRTNLINRSDYVVALDTGRESIDESVDSLNVSVATALLISKIVN